VSQPVSRLAMCEAATILIAGQRRVMIGRTDELHRLVRLVSAPGTGVAVLGGEPGIGKTRLVLELLDQVPDDTVVLVGQAEPGSLGRPFELLLSALDGRAEVDKETAPTAHRHVALLGAVAGKPPSYRTAMVLHKRTGGNPFFLAELLRTGGDVDDLCESPPEGTRAPNHLHLNRFRSAQSRINTPGPWGMPVVRAPSEHHI